MLVISRLSYTYISSMYIFYFPGTVKAHYFPWRQKEGINKAVRINPSLTASAVQQSLPGFSYTMRTGWFGFVHSSNPRPKQVKRSPRLTSLCNFKGETSGAKSVTTDHWCCFVSTMANSLAAHADPWNPSSGRESRSCCFRSYFISNSLHFLLDSSFTRYLVLLLS